MLSSQTLTNDANDEVNTSTMSATTNTDYVALRTLTQLLSRFGMNSPPPETTSTVIVKKLLLPLLRRRDEGGNIINDQTMFAAVDCLAGLMKFRGMASAMFLPLVLDVVMDVEVTRKNPLRGQIVRVLKEGVGEFCKPSDESESESGKSGNGSDSGDTVRCKKEAACYARAMQSFIEAVRGMNDKEGDDINVKGLAMTMLKVVNAVVVKNAGDKNKNNNKNNSINNNNNNNDRNKNIDPDEDKVLLQCIGTVGQMVRTYPDVMTTIWGSVSPVMTRVFRDLSLGEGTRKEAIATLSAMVKITPLKTWSELLRGSAGGRGRVRGREGGGQPSKVFGLLSSLLKFVGSSVLDEVDKGVFWEFSELVSEIVKGGGGSDGRCHVSDDFVDAEVGALTSLARCLVKPGDDERKKPAAECLIATAGGAATTTGETTPMQLPMIRLIEGEPRFMGGLVQRASEAGCIHALHVLGAIAKADFKVVKKSGDVRGIVARAEKSEKKAVRTKAIRLLENYLNGRCGDADGDADGDAGGNANGNADGRAHRKDSEVEEAIDISFVGEWINDSISEVRASAAKCYGYLLTNDFENGLNFVPSDVFYGNQETNAAVKAAICRALGRIAITASHALDGNKTMEILKIHVKDKSSNVRAAAMFAVGNLGQRAEQLSIGADALLAFMEICEDMLGDEDDKVIVSAVRASGFIFSSFLLAGGEFGKGNEIIQILNGKMRASLDAKGDVTLNSKRRIAINKQAWGSCFALSHILKLTCGDRVIGNYTGSFSMKESFDLLIESVSHASNGKVFAAAVAAMREGGLHGIERERAGDVILAVLRRNEHHEGKEGGVGQAAEDLLWLYLQDREGKNSIAEVAPEICALNGGLQFLYEFLVEKGAGGDTGGGFGLIIRALDELNWEQTEAIDVSLLQKFASRAAMEKRLEVRRNSPIAKLKNLRIEEGEVEAETEDRTDNVDSADIEEEDEEEL